ncbi:MAG TPA: hypothetical protein VNA25_24650 [Phycisphaerae bacterium]|nr:hypothetical protein [Phycisphaerae bacterium]
MLEQASLRDQFQSLLNQHRQAMKLYERLAGSAGDAGIRQQALQLQRDKARHVRLTERLLEIVD